MIVEHDLSLLSWFQKLTPTFRVVIIDKEVLCSFAFFLICYVVHDFKRGMQKHDTHVTCALPVYLDYLKKESQS